MKYRIKDNSALDTFGLFLFWWLILPFGYENNPFSIQYKKHWWNKWKDYEEYGTSKRFKTYDEALQYINKLKNHE